jgi:rubrerythrin
MNALDFMTRFEEDCLKFYETLGSNEHNPELVNLYGLLADSQRRHLGILETLKETTRDSDVESALAERAAHVVNGLREVLFAHDITKEMKNDRDAFSHVLHAEEEMIKLCEGMAKAEPNENAKALFAWLAENEKKHLMEIEGIYDFVEAPDCYLEWGEFSNLRSL